MATKTSETWVNFKPGNFVSGTGPACAKLAIVGEAPGEQEERNGVPFYPDAPVGKMLRGLLKDNGFNAEDAYITNVCKYRPPLNDLKNLHAIGISLESQIDLLHKELSTLKPNAVLALGNTALKALTGKSGISKYRGSILTSPFGSYKVIAGIHPGNIINPRGRDGAGPQWKFILKLDIRRAIEESSTNTLNVPKRHLEIVTSAIQLYRALQQYRNKTEVAIDIETSQCIPYCVGLAFHPYHAIIVPLFDMSNYRSNLPRIPPHELADIWIELSRFLSKPGLKYIGQNFKFDHEKLVAPAKLIKWEKGRLHADTSLMAGVAYAEYPKSLQFLTSIFTREPYYKDEGKEFNPKTDKIEQKLYYCGKDVTVTYEIYEALKVELRNQGTYDFYFNFVNNFHDLYMEMEAEGVEVDLESKKKSLEVFEELLIKTHAELKDLVGHEVNVDSPKQVYNLLFNELGLPTRANTQEDTLVALLANHTEENSKERRILELVMKERQVDTNAQYLRSETDYDGKARTSTRITGTETGRASDNILKPPVRPSKCGWNFKTLPAHGQYGKNIRSIFVSGVQDYLLAVDLRQAEARIVAFLSNDPEALLEFDTIDTYVKTAIMCMELKSLNKGDEGYGAKRYVGKKVKLSYGYGIGKHRLTLDINSEAKRAGIDINVSEKDAARYLTNIARGYPKVKDVFQRETMIACMRDKRTLTSPFGRKRTFYGELKQEEVYANIPQSIPPDIIRAAYLRLERYPEWDKSEIRLVMEKHDALNFLVKRGTELKYAPLIEREFTKPIDYKNCSLPRGELSIPCETKIGTNYRDMEVLKLA